MATLFSMGPTPHLLPPAFSGPTSQGPNSRKTTHVSFFNDAHSLRQAYLTTGVLPEPAPREAVQPDANTPVIKFTKGLDQFRRWYHRRTDDTPLAKWTPEARRLLRQELTWFKKLHDDLAA